uniref:C2H2-type domain-containing protein n=1 Tax=Strongyloides stercoralis TaxID=6248 RepID=A0A0K0EBM3_STRER
MVRRRRRESVTLMSKDGHASRNKTLDTLMKESVTEEVGRNRNIINNQGKSSKKFLWIFVGLFIVLVIAIVLALSGVYYKYVMNKKETLEKDSYLKHLIAQVNQGKNVRWKAKFNKFGEKVTNYNYKTVRNSTAVKEYIGHLEKFYKSPRMKAHLQMLEDFPKSQLPKDFDARVKWPNCPSISTIVNQGNCGSCFSASAVSVASDRACIGSNGTYQNFLSIEDVLSCCKVCGSCYGGDPLKVLVYWVIEGIVTGGRDGCRPYSMDISCGTPCSPSTYVEGEYKRSCIRSCQNIYYQNEYEEDKHFGSIAYTLVSRSMTVNQNGDNRVIVPSIVEYFNKTSSKPLTIEEVRTIIKKELFLVGPTTMAFPVTEEFLHYSGGIFHPYPEENFNKRIIYWHVVKLIGWGTDSDGNHYWLAVNSFGNYWGDNGIFKIDTSLLEHFGLEYEAGLL